MLKHRMLLGPLMIVALIGMIWAEESLRAAGMTPGWLTLGVMLAIGAGAANELAKVFRAKQIASSAPVLTISIWAGVLASSFAGHPNAGSAGGAILGAAGGAVTLMAMVYYSRSRSSSGVIAATATTLLGFVYLGLLGGFFVLLLREYGGWTLLAVALVTKSCDIGAYFTGTTIGKNKLIPWLSPGKTWEGLFGGMALAGLVGAGAAWLSLTWEGPVRVELWQGAAMGLVFGAVGQIGDLAASMLKRDAGIKDYAQTIPGFGGVMDIVDSPLLVAPVAFWLLRVVMWANEAAAGGSGTGAAG